MGFAAVRVEGDGHFLNLGLEEGGLDDHFGGEFHSCAALVQAVEQILAKAAHAAVDVVDLGPEP